MQPSSLSVRLSLRHIGSFFNLTFKRDLPFITATLETTYQQTAPAQTMSEMLIETEESQQEKNDNAGLTLKTLS